MDFGYVFNPLDRPATGQGEALTVAVQLKTLYMPDRDFQHGSKNLYSTNDTKNQVIYQKFRNPIHTFGYSGRMKIHRKNFGIFPPVHPELPLIFSCLSSDS